MAFVVLYDACVLYPASLRDLLVRLARTGVVRARWTERILDECVASLRSDRPDVAADALARTRALLGIAVPDALVTGYEPLVEALDLPDPGDRHVLAAAIHAGAQVIVTFNLADFPPDRLAAYGCEARHPDDFVLDSLDLAPGPILQALVEQAAALRRPPTSVEDVLDRLLRLGLVRSVARFRELLAR